MGNLLRQFARNVPSSIEGAQLEQQAARFGGARRSVVAQPWLPASPTTSTVEDRLPVRQQSWQGPFAKQMEPERRVGRV